MNVLVLGSASLLLIGCAAEQARDVPLDELVCEEDSDCAVITYDQRTPMCEMIERPFAISKTAARRRNRGCVKIGHPCYHDERDWVAVCSDHVCKIRTSRWFRSPKPRCREGARD